jgi:hypothetical protein
MMKKVSIAVGISLVAGFAAAAIVLRATGPGSTTRQSVVPASHFDESAATDERIRALEAAVSEERQARQLLEDELFVLFAEIERLEASVGDRDNSRDERDGANIEATQVLERRRGDRSSGGQRDDLIAVGLAPDRADWILQRESELRYESMQARFEARNSGASQDFFDAALNSESMLRAEIGDTEYEMYLEANNRPTAVSISGVMASSPGERAGLQTGDSPGERAGLQTGDQIVNYDGQRVFSTWELVQQTMGGGGEGTVVVDLLRDGAPIQIVLPRGPIGVEVGRSRGR